MRGRLVRNLIEYGNLFISFLRRGKKYVVDEQQVKVNLGCGLAVAPGWVNIDGSLNSLLASWPVAVQNIIYKFSGAKQYYTWEAYHHILSTNRFIHHDLAYGIPLPDSCVEYVYTSHFLEHLPKPVGEHLIRESHRVLKRGGRIRVVVPDLEIAVAHYSRGEKERMLDHFFYTEMDGSSFSAHKYLYDFELLESLLLRCGFAGVERQAYRRGHTPDLDVLDNRPEDSLYVEAVKQ